MKPTCVFDAICGSGWGGRKKGSDVSLRVIIEMCRYTVEDGIGVIRWKEEFGKADGEVTRPYRLYVSKSEYGFSLLYCKSCETETIESYRVTLNSESYDRGENFMERHIWPHNHLSLFTGISPNLPNIYPVTLC